jgi:hypothetical protein
MDSLKRFEPLPEVEYDAGLLRLVFCDLLTPAEMAAGAGESDGGTRISFVPDNGVGLDPKYADKISGIPPAAPPPKTVRGQGEQSNDRQIIHLDRGEICAEPELPGTRHCFSPREPRPGAAESDEPREVDHDPI